MSGYGQGRTVEVHGTEAVAFSLRWDDHYVQGSLPPSAAYRVINAAMAPDAVVHLPSHVSEADANRFRDAFRRATHRDGNPNPPPMPDPGKYSP